MWYVVGGVGAVLVLILLWVLARGGKYKQVFADAHFLEVAAKLSTLKEAALAQADQSPDLAAPPREDDERRLITSAGLVVLYTIAPEGGGYEHHLSVSLAGGYTAHAVGDMYIWWLLRLLGVEARRCSLLISPRTVHFAMWLADPEEQDKLAARTIAEPSAAELAQFRQEWVRSWQSVTWQHMPG